MAEKTWKDNNHTYKWSHNPKGLGEKLKHKKENTMLYKGQVLHDRVQNACNGFLLGKLGVGWHDLADTVSIWDWIDEERGMKDKDISELVPDIVWDKLDTDGTISSFMNRCTLTSTVYGECGCGFCDK
mgnify:FL=1